MNLIANSPDRTNAVQLILAQSSFPWSYPERSGWSRQLCRVVARRCRDIRLMAAILRAFSKDLRSFERKPERVHARIFQLSSGHAVAEAL